MPEAIGIFILPPSKAELERRLTGRSQDSAEDSAEVIAGRMAQATSEISHYAEYDFIIVNDDFDTALIDFVAIIRSQRLTGAGQIHTHNDMLRDLLAE